MKRFSLFAVLFLCLGFVFPIVTNAQSDENLDEIMNTTIFPEIPGPRQNVDISIESYTYDLSRSKISWYINNSLKSSNVGQKTFSFTTGEVGSVSSVKYKVTTAEGYNFEKTLNITPGEVNLVWESLGYTPPFYKGKSLFSFEGTARIVAIPNLISPNGTKYKQEELVYTWKHGMGTDVEASGYGKSTFYFNGDIIARPEDITVEVSNLNNTVRASNKTTIQAVQPEVYVYENNPSLGILFNKAITNVFNLPGNEDSLVVEPFYFNNPDNEAQYTWSINGQDANEASKFITFRNTTGEEGHSNIGIDVTNQKRIMQSVNTLFDIYFGSNTSKNSLLENIFGNQN
ncbi:MAG: hypothetical protein WCO12_02535 [bacterium]